ncbi:MAG: COX15/CtaA family protein [Burkholderiales bacterium]
MKTTGNLQPIPARCMSCKPVAAWLLTCCALVFAMVVLGGVTRLTRSGLSIVEWQPLVGAIPPLTHQDWLDMFQKYQQTPEYLKANFGMTLEEFQGIFWLEYFHRLLGRAIGLVFFLPFLYFLVRRRLEKPLISRLAGIFALGALQGAMGWYMVKSGLVDDPHVSQYRLAAHLALAFLIYGAMLWLALDLLFPAAARHQAVETPALRRFAWGLTILICVMVVSGAFVAGIHAGLAYNTFPLMNGHVVPPELFMLDPWYENFFSNMATVQFDHRLIAWLLAILVPWFCYRALRIGLPSRAQLLCHLLLLALAMQIALGISTLLMAVPVFLAAAHQAGALFVFTAALALNHELAGRSVPQSGNPACHTV